MGVAGAQLIISAVTATASGDVADAAARSLTPGQFFLDINSVAPATKRANAAAVEFVDAIPRNPSGKILRRVLKARA